MASDTCGGSSVEVERAPPLGEQVHDPRDFYASDSPVVVDLDSDQELYRSAEEFEVHNTPEVQDEHRFAARPVRLFLFFTYPLPLNDGKNSQQLPQPVTPPWQTSHPSPQLSHLSTGPPALHSSHGRISQHQAVTSGGEYVRGSHLRAGSHEYQPSNPRTPNVTSMLLACPSSLRGLGAIILLREAGSATVGGDEADVDRVHGAVELEQMRWPSVSNPTTPMYHILC